MLTLGLKDKNIVVTGATGFLGRYLIRFLQDEGANVIGTDVNLDSGIDFLEIADSIAVYNYALKLKKEYGHIDGMVNNAAISIKGNKIDPIAFGEVLDVNLKGTYNCIVYLQDILSTNASIVNVSSVYGMLSPDFRIYEQNEDEYNASAYGASKAGIVQLTKYYAAQLAPIRVNAVSPGGIFQGHNQEFVDRYSERVPLKRMAQPEEVVKAIMFLLSPMSSYITGTNLAVTGGMEIW